MGDRNAAAGFSKVIGSLVLLCGLVTLRPAAIDYRLLAQSAGGVSRPWPCWTDLSSPNSIFRPAISPCGPAALISLAPREQLRVARAILVPGAPASLSATVSGRTVLLTWTAPRGDAATAYVLEVGSAIGRSDRVNADTGSETTTITATDVPPGTYFMRVRARTWSGTSIPSNEIVVTVRATETCTGLPGAPTGLVASTNASLVTLTWQPPSGCVPEGYYVDAGSAPGLSDLARLEVRSPTFSASGVPSGTYYVRVTSKGGSAPSNEVLVSVSGGCGGAPPPPAPTGFASQVSGTTVVLTWNGVQSAPWPSSYILEAGSSSGASNLLVTDTGDLTTSLTATAPVGTYYVRVRARSICGTGSPSTEIVVVVTGTSTTRVWIPEATVMTDVSAGFPGRAFADVAAFQTQDGRWRLLFDAGGAIRMAISPDGISSLVIQSALPLPSTTLRPAGVKVFRLDNGQIRVYFSATDMYSAISSDDGQTFTMEDGVRLTTAAVAANGNITGGSVVRVRAGLWRMYFSDRAHVFSATSTDLLTWTPDTGVRIGPGAVLPVSSVHPTAIVNADGTISLFYFHGPTRRDPTPSLIGLFTSTSADGLSFTSETPIGITSGGDPDVVPLPGGGYRMYYNRGDDFGGTIYSARSVGTTP